MQPAFIRITAVAALVLAVQGACAHDPSQHAEPGQAKPDQAEPGCAGMKDIDLSKMNMDDPAMKTLHEKCMNQMHEGHGSGKAPGPQAPAAPGQSQHDGHGGH